MRIARYRRSVIGVAFGVLLFGTSSAWALNEVIDRSCDPDCATKPPKESLFIRASGDLDGNGASPEISGTLAQGKKKRVVRVDLTYDWFTTNNQFRAFTVRVNDRFPAPSFTVINHFTSCGPGECLVTATYWFDLDAQELTYPGEFYGQPLKVDLEASTKAADANGVYNATLAIQLVKKK
jgi:hypothetical protein